MASPISSDGARFLQRFRQVLRRVYACKFFMELCFEILLFLFVAITLPALLASRSWSELLWSGGLLLAATLLTIVFWRAQKGIQDALWEFSVTEDVNDQPGR